MRGRIVLPGWRAFGRSALVSFVAFCLDFFLCMFFVSRLGIGYLPATMMSFMAGTILNYALCVLLVFGRSDLDSWRVEFLAFLGIAGMGLLLNGLCMYFFTSIVGLYYLVSRVVSAAFVFFFNYWCRKYLLFSSSAKGLPALLKRLGSCALPWGRSRRALGESPDSGDSGESMHRSECSSD